MNDVGKQLFRDAIRGVKPIATKHAPVERAKPKPKARFRRADEREVLQESLHGELDPAWTSTGDEIVFRRPGVPETILRKLRRGHYSVAAELDLHGFTSPQARHALRDFITDQLVRGVRCVRVIHGKGLGSGPRGPVLKNVVNVCLRRMDVVVAFGSARQHDGGSGAIYVLLRERG